MVSCADLGSSPQVGEQMAPAVYGVEEEKLGEFYAKRTILKEEVLPEHIGAAAFGLVAVDLLGYNWTTYSS